jgi:Holliday junction resolvase RusA-like endonuclease
MFLPVAPYPKPRWQKSDRWDPRPCIKRYHAFQNDLKAALNGREVPMPCHLVFYIPMAASWTAKRKREMFGTAHTQTPDRDNLDKAFWDAIFHTHDTGDDSHIWDCRTTKVWCYAGQEGIEVRPLEAFKFDRDQFERYQAEVSENAA